jgi:hypothetical protein
MAKENETKKERSYTIHFVNGQSMSIKAADVKIDAKENRVYFFNAEGKPADDGIYILSGIVAIKPTSPASQGRFRM